MHVVSEDFHEDREGEDLDSLSERFRRARRLGAIKPKPKDAQERTDALTRRPLNYHQEEETRKSETNRWLENHFGSESGRSGSSHNDLEDEGGVQTAGGNVITITMSPRPATPEDMPDAAPPSRRWDSPASPTQAHGSNPPPPPPPPKPAHLWTPPAPVSPRQPVPPGPASEEITNSMITAARARLRSTGRILDESEHDSPPASSSANAGASRFTSTPITTERVSSPVSPTGVNRSFDDPVYTSRFRSGSPSGLTPIRVFSTPARNSALGTNSPPESPPPPLPSTPPPSQNNVGRSQSFNVTNKNWMNGKTKVSTSSRPFQSKMKEYRSEEQLDSVGHKTSRHWPPPRRDPSPEPVREPTPPPPPRHRSTHTSHTPSANYLHYNTAPARSHRSSRTTEIATQTSARDSTTQTALSPVPPPRTKRKSKPKTYYFGQESSYSTSPSSRVTRSPGISTTTVSYTSTSRHNQSSPKVERRFRTTKTITPVVVAAASTSTTTDKSKLKNRSWYYRSMDELSSGVDGPPQPSWTNTIDPRRRPRNYSKEPEIKTLPKKLVNGTLSPSPSKTYIFGSGNNSSSSRRGAESATHLRRNHGGSLINVSLAGMSSPKSPYIGDIPEKQHSPKTNRPVIRSHSLNVKPAPLSTLASSTGPSVSSGLASQQRTSSVYRSSPYLNLRSPNLIATIARTNSARRTDDKENDHQEQVESPPPADRYRQSHHTTSSRATTHHNLNATTQNSKSSHHVNATTKNSKNSHHVNATTQNSKNSPPMVNGGGGDGYEDEKRNRFMKGLLTTAPELFHFIHGEDDDKKGGRNTGTNNRTRHSSPESPPQLIRPPSSSPLTSPSATSPPATTTQPRIFTFGRGETGSTKRPSTPSKDVVSPSNRLSSLGRQRESLTSNHLDTNRDTHHTSNSSERNSLTSQYHRNNNSLTTTNGNNSLNRPKFNLKSPTGGSILYSTSFQNRADPSPTSWGRRGSDSRDHENMVGEKRSGNVASNLTRDGAVLIPVRDWNSR